MLQQGQSEKPKNAPESGGVRDRTTGTSHATVALS
jgi:hypothetical protein